MPWTYRDVPGVWGIPHGVLGPLGSLCGVLWVPLRQSEAELSAQVAIFRALHMRLPQKCPLTLFKDFMPVLQMLTAVKAVYTFICIFGLYVQMHL